MMPTDIGCEYYVDPTPYLTIEAAALAAAKYATVAGLDSATTTCALASITSEVEQLAAEAKITVAAITDALWLGGFLPVGTVPKVQCGKQPPGTALDPASVEDLNLCVEAGWGWLDGSPWEYQNWDQNSSAGNSPEPDNIGGESNGGGGYNGVPDQLYTAIVSNGAWFDVFSNQGSNNINGGALVKCCQSTTGDVAGTDGLAKLPLQ
eukprot:scaffold2015_cov186-Amphora_coffeaeformis.AAC.14